MQRRVDMEDATILYAHRGFMDDLEKSIKLVEQDIDETGKMPQSRTNEWRRATEGVLAGLAELLFSLSVPFSFPREDTQKIRDLRSRIHELNGRCQAVDKAELSSLSAHTKLMPLRYKAELSSLPAQTKLMPLRYKAELSSLPAQTKLMPLRYK